MEYLYGFVTKTGYECLKRSSGWKQFTEKWLFTNCSAILWPETLQTVKVSLNYGAVYSIFIRCVWTGRELLNLLNAYTVLKLEWQPTAWRRGVPSYRISIKDVYIDSSSSVQCFLLSISLFLFARWSRISLKTKRCNFGVLYGCFHVFLPFSRG